MVKIKVYDNNLIQYFYTHFRQNYEATSFKFIEFNNIGLFIFDDYDPIEIIYENILKYYPDGGNSFTIKIKPQKGSHIKAIIKPLDYDKNA